MARIVEGDFVIVRAEAAGVHAGTFRARYGREVALTNSRRIWSWEGAISLSELAVYGPAFPEKCEFAVPVDIEILDACEVIRCTEKAAHIIMEVVPEWK